MFTSIANAIIAMMSAITTFAGATNKLANATDNWCTIAEEASGLSLDQARFNRALQRKELEAKLAAASTPNP